ncbi:hypothetical protein FHT86_000317 [Rhizobium sp. BK313]|uniref:hypothetical protein n=1 Tax=Rhizobium sp. BK313 TaxID=2587081 RepID=UPI00105CCEDD|nr:hypothetical protein [Rhizobium sp. BK313]MBB3452061.1 hypothetical protein [Rhizobium sp. BK313]
MEAQTEIDLHARTGPELKPERHLRKLQPLIAEDGRSVKIEQLKTTINFSSRRFPDRWVQGDQACRSHLDNKNKQMRKF